MQGSWLCHRFGTTHIIKQIRLRLAFQIAFHSPASPYETKIEIEVKSTDIIHPSSPTPNDLSNYKLSYIDQISPRIFGCIPFLYKAPNSSLTNSEISSRLKKALSKTLSIYYPLAGRLVDNSYVNCNDQGINYVEAHANCTLSEVVNEPIPHEIDKLFPRNIVDNVSDNCCIIQATFFKCGGLAIGVALSHKLGDGWSSLLFINCWAAIFRGDTHIQSPVFNAATIFSPKPDLGGNNPEIGMMSKEGIITKRFLFTASKINDLRDKYSNTTRATRIEALTAFILTRFMVSTQKKDDPKRIVTLQHVVNLRKRVVPPLSEDLFGNLVLPTMAVPVLGDGEEEEGYEIVQNLRAAIRRVGGDYVTTLQEGSQTFDSKAFGGGELVPFYFTSICGFPIFKADFGWGKPVWSGSGTTSFKNVVAFMDSSSSSSGGSGGIQAWVCLKVEDMAKFEVDEEFLAYAATSMAESC